MKLGISSWAYPWSVGVPSNPPPTPLGPFELLDRATSLGVDILQIADNLPLHQFSEADVKQLRRRADESGVQIEVGTIGIDPDHLEAYRGIAKTLGSPILRIVIDTPERKPSESEVIDELGALMPAFGDDDVRLLIENHDRFPARSLATILRSIDDPYVGICLDTVNSLGSLETVETVLETLRPWVMNVHVKDFVIRRKDHKMGFEVIGTTAGEGDLRLPPLLETIGALPGAPNVVLEQWPPAEGDLAATVAKEESWAAASIQYLQQYL